jgi:beta-phosphoglucomutase family hydrolase
MNHTSSVRSDIYYIPLLTELDLIFNPRAINITSLTGLALPTFCTKPSTVFKLRMDERTNHSKQTGPRAVLWDMDGTLLDSADYHWLTWRETLAEEGFELTRELFDESFGRRNDATLRGYFGEDFPLSEIERIGSRKEERYREMLRTGGAGLLPGVKQWLARLKADGWRQALASSAMLLNIEVILDVLDVRGYFDAVVSAEDVKTGKPDPEVFLLASKKVGVPPRRSIVIEDSPAGLEAARRAGMRTIGVRSTHDRLEADIVVDTLEEIAADAFDKLLSRGRP